MKTTSRCVICFAILALYALPDCSWADTFGTGVNAFQIEFVNIGNPANPPDTSGIVNPAGAVSYSYRLGKYEISEQMVTKATAVGGLGITQDTRVGDKPSTNISWNHAARFVNWLNTSTGHAPAYKFTTQPGQAGYVANSDIKAWAPSDAGYNPNNLARNSLARYFLPSVDEWYKAAYYDPVSGVYFNYPTGSDSVPVAVSSGTAAGTAVFEQPTATGPADVSLAGGLSPYGTMAQGGNVWEWIEPGANHLLDGSTVPRLMRGAQWSDFGGFMSTSFGGSLALSIGGDRGIGLRVASVPEPSTLLLVVVIGALGLLRRTRQ